MKGGYTYTPKASRDAEQCLFDAWKESGNPTFDGPVTMTIVYSKESTSVWVAPLVMETKNWGGDIDNLIKLTLDGLQGEGGAYLNDSQVRRVDVIKL
jgi:Holliday junction resolvase RusA-like endonuclease